MSKNWIEEAAIEINLRPNSGLTTKEIIEKHCPFKVDTAYMELGAAEEAFKLLEESKREHQEERYDIYGCEALWNDGHSCTCGADEWNAKVDAVLAKVVKPEEVCHECNGKGTVLDATEPLLGSHTFEATCEDCNGTGKKK